MIMKKLLLPILAILLPAGACTRADSPSEQRAEALAEEAEAAPEAHRIDPADLPSPPEAPQATAPTSPEQARLQELLRAMSEASDEAAGAEGDTECERAYESSRRFAESLRQRMGGDPLPPDTPARRTAFVQACGRLPANVQKCMVMSYSVTHTEECSTVRRDMSDETREGVRELMADLGPLAAAAVPEEEQ
jgi:hypothetical protein